MVAEQQVVGLGPPVVQVGVAVPREPDAAIEVTGEGIQIHGGVGFTWDCDAHLHYRRAKADDLLLGYHGTWRTKVGDSYLATA